MIDLEEKIILDRIRTGKKREEFLQKGPWKEIGKIEFITLEGIKVYGLGVIVRVWHDRAPYVVFSKAELASINSRKYYSGDYWFVSEKTIREHNGAYYDLNGRKTEMLEKLKKYADELKTKEKE